MKAATARRRKYAQDYYLSHKAIYAQRDAAWRKNNLARRSEITKRWYRKSKKNLEKRRAYNRKWYRDHPEYSAVKTLKRWALKRCAAINLRSIKAFVKKIRSMDFATCYFCEKLVPTKGIHFDHIVPLTKGGQHSIENLCVSCPSCNHSKYNHTISSWIKTGQQLLDL